MRRATVELDAAPGYLSDIGRELAAFAMGEGVLRRPLGNVVRCLPLYCSTDDELARVYHVLQRFLEGGRAETPASGGPVDDLVLRCRWVNCTDELDALAVAVEAAGLDAVLARAARADLTR